MLRPDRRHRLPRLQPAGRADHFALGPRIAGRAIEHGGGALWRARPIDPKQIAAEADVDVIVTGTLLRAGDEVRVTSQLTDASTGTLLWSDTAQAPVGDLFQVQDELTRRIVDSLSLPLTSARAAAAAA